MIHEFYFNEAIVLKIQQNGVLAKNSDFWTPQKWFTLCWGAEICIFSQLSHRIPTHFDNHHPRNMDILLFFVLVA